MLGQQRTFVKGRLNIHCRPIACIKAGPGICPMTELPYGLAGHLTAPGGTLNGERSLDTNHTIRVQPAPQPYGPHTAPAPLLPSVER